MALSSAAHWPSAAASGSERAARRVVAVWLLCVCALIYLMVVVGGITRLTLSGLSITQWHPIIGVIPPLSHGQWEAAFARYQQVPEYRALHDGMSLSDFKTIFFWEYAHRLLGRLIGLVFAVPLAWFWSRRRLPRGLGPPLLGILGLGFAQGLLGWYMVESGLADRVEVSQYRLDAHLLLALAIYSLILWTALGLLGSAPSPRRGTHSSETTGRAADVGVGWRRAANGLIALVGLTIAAGGFVAGNRAGLTYNTFPLMDGQFVPAGYAALHPFFRNWFENIPAVQFDHRLLAETTFVYVLALAAIGIARPLPRRILTALIALLLVATLQLALGVSTLLLVVPIPLAAAHQAGAVLLLTAAIVFRHVLRPAREMDAKAGAPI